MALHHVRPLYPGIVQDPGINSGRPVLQGTRVFVDLILDHLESHMSVDEICQEYGLQPAQVEAVQHLSQAQVHYVRGYADALENSLGK